MSATSPRLDALTGLSDDELADVLIDNPRAYMAVKGAVAEKHLEKILSKHVEGGQIVSLRAASGDFDKDFYVVLPDGRELSIECKNVEVIKTSNKAAGIDYLAFLHSEGVVTAEDLEINADLFGDNDIREALSGLQARQIGDRIRKLPQRYRESGMPRYQFSRQLLDVDRPQAGVVREFLEQFDGNKLSIDFQRTRNSTASDGDTKRKRLYRVGEIDIVGACLFSRTTHWDFIFSRATNFPLHKTYEDRYANGLKIQPEHWTVNVTDLFGEM